MSLFVNEWVCRANDAIHLRLINTADELDAAIAASKTRAQQPYTAPSQSTPFSAAAATAAAAATLNSASSSASSSGAPFASSSVPFMPTFTHQLFTEEKISGYKGLQIDLWFLANSCYMYFAFSFVEHNSDADAVVDDIKKKIVARASIGQWTGDVSTFRRRLHADKYFAPPGVLMNNYTFQASDDDGSPSSSSSSSSSQVSSSSTSSPARKKVKTTRHGDGRRVRAATSPGSGGGGGGSGGGGGGGGGGDGGDGGEVSIELYTGTFDDEEVRDFHRRIQYFLLFFIDGSSFINERDTVWDVLMVWRRTRAITAAKKTTRVTKKTKSGHATTGGGQSSSVVDKDEADTFAFVGYTTLYKFLRYPTGWRLRVSQILILPPFQRQGHGQRLLQAVYTEAREKQFVEVNVEDPSIGFQAVRDLTDMMSCQLEGFFHVDDYGCLAEPTPAFVRRVATHMRITPLQVHRCYEIFQLATIDRDDADAYTAYRLMVKKTLHRKHEAELSVFGRNIPQKKERIQELYAVAEARNTSLFAKHESKLRTMYDANDSLRVDVEKKARLRADEHAADGASGSAGAPAKA
jgi:histone acetyltransferase 1